MIFKVFLLLIPFHLLASSNISINEYKKKMELYSKKQRTHFHNILAIDYSLRIAKILDPKNINQYKKAQTIKEKIKVLKKYKQPITLPTPRKFENISEISRSSDYLLVQQLLYEEDFTNHDLYRSIENSSAFPHETINIILDQLIRAKREIVLETTSLSDPLIIDSLIKLKILLPEISIRIIIKQNVEDKIVDYPESSFFPMLKKYNIPVKIYRAQKQDYITSIIVDRKLIILSPSSLSLINTRAKKSFYGIQLYSKGLANRLMTGFERVWKDKNDTYIVDIENFDLLKEDEKAHRVKGQIIRHILINWDSQ